MIQKKQNVMHQNRSFPQEHIRNILQSSPPVTEYFISPQLTYTIATEHMAALKARKSVICYYIISSSQLGSTEG